MDTKFVGDDIHRRRHDIFFVEDFEKVRNQRNVLCCEAAVFMCVCVSNFLNSTSTNRYYIKDS